MDKDFTDIKSPKEMNLLISFADLTLFTKAVRSNNASSKQVFDVLSKFYDLTGAIMDKAGGKVVKFIGDFGYFCKTISDVFLYIGNRN